MGPPPAGARRPRAGLRQPGRRRAGRRTGPRQPPGRSSPRPGPAGLVEQDGPVRAARPARPVGDQHHGPPGHQLLDGVDDHPGGERVQVRDGLVEQQQGRVLEERPGQRDPLPLARGQPRAPLPERRAVVRGQRPDELRPRRPGWPPRAMSAADASGRPSAMLLATVPSNRYGCWGTQAIWRRQAARSNAAMSVAGVPLPGAPAGPRSAPRSARRTAAAGPAASSSPRRSARSARSAHRAGSRTTPGPAPARPGPGTPARFR